MNTFTFHCHGKLLLRVIFALVITLVAFPKPHATATNLTVTNLTVTKIADTYDGLCDADCSLREAIVAANGSPDEDMIIVPSGIYTLTLAGMDENAAATGDLDLSSNVTILGEGWETTILDANQLDRVFHVLTGTVTIMGVTIQGGKVTGLRLGGGLANDAGAVHLVDSHIASNQAFDNPGGGITNSGTLTLTNSSVENNNSYVTAGGLYNTLSGTLSISQTLISDNTISGPWAHGGGLYNDGGTVSITHSTLSHHDRGMSIWNDGNLTVTNSTISDNPSGGIFTGGALMLNNSTLYNNVGVEPTYGVYGIWVYPSAASATLRNTLLAGHTILGQSYECSGTLMSDDYNLIENPGGCLISGETAHNITGVDPKLGVLLANGGATPTRALLPGSPAIDAGNPNAPGTGGATCERDDQRGVPRPQNTYCDIGAYEGSYYSSYLPIVSYMP